MERPKRLVLAGAESFAMARNGLLLGLGLMAFIGAIVLTQTDASPEDLALPFAALGGFWLLWGLIYLFVGLAHRLGDRRAIGRLFRNEMWQEWEFTAEEWREKVEAEYEASRKAAEGGCIGVVFSGLAGLVLAGVLVAVGKYAVKDERYMPIFLISAGAVLVLLVGVGAAQPLRARLEARRSRRKALRVSRPRVWFGAAGVYHEALGYTSLRELQSVKDQVEKQRSIVFTVEVVTVMGGAGHSSRSVHNQPVPFTVPSGYEEQAAALVRRYRQERLRP